MIGRSSPLASAAVRKLALRTGRAGKPKLTLETPSTQRTPSRSLHARMAARISGISGWLVAAAMTRQSIAMSSRRRPASSAASTMRPAIATRSSACAGMPFSSRVSPTIVAPWRAAMGRTVARLSALPLTELMSGRPAYVRQAASSADASDESSCSGTGTVACRRSLTARSTAGSSRPGTPTLTSRIAAPASTCPTASETMRS